MNNTTAKRIAFHNEEDRKLTYQDVMDQIERSDLSGVSKINKSLTKKQVADIMIAGFVNYDPTRKDEVIKTTKMDMLHDYLVLSHEGIALKNCLREFF